MATLNDSLAPAWINTHGGNSSAPSPDVSVATPSEITSTSWTIPWTGGGAPYPVDLTIDDLSFIP